MKKRPSKFETVTFSCPLCTRNLTRRVPKGARSVVSWCSTRGEIVTLRRWEKP